MPTLKDFKRLVRRRMQKTGESYTAARAQLLETPRLANSVPAPAKAAATKAPPARRTRPPRVTTDFETLSGISEASIKASTGCGWSKWVKSLDHVQAFEWPHRKIAEHVQAKYKVSDWWSQTVAVGYERIRGLRQIGQRRGGTFEASKSRTFPVPVATLYRAFAEARVRSKWLPKSGATVRKTSADKSVRMTWADGTAVDVWLLPKGAGKSTVQIQHRKLPDRESMARMKVYWTERLEALGKSLAK